MSADRLLILDDDLDVARTIAFVARREGFDVRVHAIPEAFFADVSDFDPTFIAVDLVMPAMDGIEVVRSLATLGCQANIILTSGMGGKVLESAERLASERGLNVRGVLPKPFRAQALRDLLVRTPERHPSFGPANSLATQIITATELRDALDTHRFELNYQPKVSLADGHTVGVEALARWSTQRLGQVPPDTFVPLIEAAGLIHTFTYNVIDLGLHWFAGLPTNTDLSLALNLSAYNLTDAQLPDRLLDSCNRLAIDPGTVILELTETGAMTSLAEALDILTRMRIKGFRLAIDDFGTGYSSMVQLARLPFSEIKIDKSFVGAMLFSSEARKIVESTIHLGRSLELQIVAEGVENMATAELLRDLGCDLAQGYLFARPMDGDTTKAWLHESISASVG